MGLISKNKGNYLQYCEEGEDVRYYQKASVVQKLDLSTTQMAIQWGHFGNQFPIHWIKFIQWIALSIPLLHNWGLYHKIYSELKPIHSPEIFVKNAIWSKSRHFLTAIYLAKKNQIFSANMSPVILHLYYNMKPSLISSGKLLLKFHTLIKYTEQ